MNDQPAPAAKPAPKFKKGDSVLRAQHEQRQPSQHKIVAGPVKAGGYDECYVISGHPGLVPAEVLTPVDAAAQKSPSGQPAEPEVIGTVNAGNPPA